MSEPIKPADKAALLANMQAGYDQFEALLASLSEEQMTMPGVNGSLVRQGQSRPPERLAELPGGEAPGHLGWSRTARSRAGS